MFLSHGVVIVSEVFYQPIQVVCVGSFTPPSHCELPRGHLFDLRLDIEDAMEVCRPGQS